MKIVIFFTESQQQHINSSAMRDGSSHIKQKSFHLELGVKLLFQTC